MRFLKLLLLVLIFTASVPNDARKANEAFERGDYRAAVQLYQQAIQQDPDNARLYFNLGKTLYELGQIDEALEAYDRYSSLTDSPAEQSLADYNKGRILTDQEQYDEALNYFREALKKNPNDTDAKHNFELALRKQMQQEQEDQQQDQEQESDGDDDQDQNDQQQDGQQDQDQQPDMGQQPGEPEDQNEDAEPQPRPQDMSREEAENILDALEQLERELLENQKKESTEPQSRNERDW